MRINSEAQAPAPPVRERPARPVEEPRERAVKAPEPPPRPEGPVGRNLDTRA